MANEKSSVLFHLMVVLLFQPLLQKFKSYKLSTFSATDSTVESVYDASHEQLKRLIIFARFYYSGTPLSSTYTAGLIQLCTVLLNNSEIQDREFYLRNCILLYEDLYRSYPSFKDVITGYLALAMKVRALPMSEIVIFKSRLDEIGKHHNLSSVEAQFFINLEEAGNNPDRAKAHKLAEQFEELAIFEDIIDANIE